MIRSLSDRSAWRKRGGPPRLPVRATRTGRSPVSRSARSRSGWSHPPLRILLSTRGSAGHVLPLVPFGHAARRAGHDVLVVAQRQHAANVARTGLPLALVDEAPAETWRPLLAAFSRTLAGLRPAVEALLHPPPRPRARRRDGRGSAGRGRDRGAGGAGGRPRLRAGVTG
jgi:hypothetical protein